MARATQMLPSGSTVRLHGLNARPELNGLVGQLGDFHEAKGRYAVRLLERNEAILLRPVNLEAIVDGAYDAAAAASLAEEQGAAGRSARLAALMQKSATQHELKEEAATYAAAISAASSRADIAEDTWDRVVELQRLVQVTCNACGVGFPALQRECVEADDALTWSRASVAYAHYLLGQPSSTSAETTEERACTPMDEARRLAQRVLRVHACSAQPCRDAMLANAVLAAEGPFSLTAAEALLSHAPDTCPLVDGRAWADARARDAMTRELQLSWDEETHMRHQAKAQARVAELRQQAGEAHE